MSQKKNLHTYQNENGQALIIVIGIGVVIGIISYVLQMSMIHAEKNLWLPRLVNENSKFENQLVARAGSIFFNPDCWKRSSEFRLGQQLDLESTNVKCTQNETQKAFDQIQSVVNELNSEYESQKVFYQLKISTKKSDLKDAIWFSLQRYEFIKQDDFDEARLNPNANSIGKADTFASQIKISYPKDIAALSHSDSTTEESRRGCPADKPIWLGLSNPHDDKSSICVGMPDCTNDSSGKIMSGYDEKFKPICANIPSRNVACAADEYMSHFEWSGKMSEPPRATCMKRPDVFDFYNFRPVGIEYGVDKPVVTNDPPSPTEPERRRVKKYCENVTEVYSYSGCLGGGRYWSICPCAAVFQKLLQKLIEKEPSIDLRSNLERLNQDSQCSNTNDFALTQVDFGELTGSVWSMSSSVERSTKTISNGNRRAASLEVSYKAELCLNKIEEIRRPSN